jgi:hypothetical protein
MNSGRYGKLLLFVVMVLAASLCFGQTQSARLQGTVHGELPVNLHDSTCR